MFIFVSNQDSVLMNAIGTSQKTETRIRKFFRQELYDIQTGIRYLLILSFVSDFKIPSVGDDLSEIDPETPKVDLVLEIRFPQRKIDDKPASYYGNTAASFWLGLSKAVANRIDDNTRIAEKKAKQMRGPLDLFTELFTLEAKIEKLGETKITQSGHDTLKSSLEDINSKLLPYQKE